jgi:hypothetical protein
MRTVLSPTPTLPIAGAPDRAGRLAPRAGRRDASGTLRRAAAALALAAAGLIAGGALGACAGTRASTTAYQTRPAKASPADVQVFTDGRPSRPYEELGLVEVRRTGLTGGYGQLIERARAEAAKMGADAILVTREKRETTNTSGAVSGPNKRGTRTVTSTTSTTEQPRVTVTAIVWSAR